MRSTRRPSIPQRRGPTTRIIYEYELHILGGPYLLKDRQQVQLTVPASRLLAFLALAERPTERRHVANSLWADSPERNASSNLRSTLWKLRREAGELVSTRNGYLSLNDEVYVDYHEARSLAHQLVDEQDKQPEPSVRGTFFTGDLLPAWSDEWVVVEREGFRQLQLHALEALCEGNTRQGHHYRAIEAGLLAVAAEPLRESAHRVLIEAHLAAGNFSEAVRQFRLLRDLLDDEFGLEPSPQLTGLLDGR